MLQATRKLDMHAGHSCNPPTTGKSCSNNVLINGSGTMRVGDVFIKHSCGIVGKGHVPIIKDGYGKVIVNGIAISRVTSTVICKKKHKSVIVTGSPNVLVGG